MLLSSSYYHTGGQCLLTQEDSGWLRATWTGLIRMPEAMAGATSYLGKVAPFCCPYLLNDNSGLRGPWFDSLDWLEHTWLPAALALGLRYVAHVVQADTHSDILTLRLPHSLAGVLTFQVFDEVAAAEEWLRGCQAAATQPLATAPAGR